MAWTPELSGLALERKQPWGHVREMNVVSCWVQLRPLGKRKRDEQEQKQAQAQAQGSL
jgi:hypothetical protein